MIKPPSLPDRKKINGKIVNTLNKNASMRLTYWYLKSKLESIRFGLEDIFDAFLLRIVHSLPDGREVTVGEAIHENPESIKLILPTFEVKALPIRIEEIKNDYK